MQNMNNFMNISQLNEYNTSPASMQSSLIPSQMNVMNNMSPFNQWNQLSPLSQMPCLVNQNQSQILLNNLDVTTQNEGNEEDEEDDDKKKIHRRSKNDTDGRTYTCKWCLKSYLSYPAWYTHCKQKHNTNNSSGRGRGRPKKELGEVNPEKNKYNPLDNSFFLKDNRTGVTTDFNEPIIKAFNMWYGYTDTYTAAEDDEQYWNKTPSLNSALINNEKIQWRNEKKNIKKYTSLEEHPFLGKFYADPHDTAFKSENENEKSDFVFMWYLNKMSTLTNPTYFTRWIIFVTWFREFVNMSYKNKCADDVQYTAVNNAEDVPDCSNEFITDFIDPDSGCDFGFNKEEIIDLTQHFCHWMYENNFTCSKLSVINGDVK